MLIPYRRHVDECEAKLRARFEERGLTEREIKKEIKTHKRCDCPVWMVGKDGTNEYIRETCKTRDWSYAEKTAIPERMKQGVEEAKPAKVRMTLSEGRERWLKEKDRLKRKSNTTRKHRLTSKVLIASLPPNIKWMDQVTRDHIEALCDRYREEKKAPKTINVYRSGMFNWFEYARGQKWVTENPVELVSLEPEDVEREETLPLDDEGDANWRLMMAEIGPFLERQKIRSSRSIKRYPESFRTLLEFLRHTGLRICDTVHFIPADIKVSECGYSWTTRQIKTKDQVTVFLSTELFGANMERLRNLPALSPKGHVFFNDGNWESYVSHHIRRPLYELGQELNFKHSLRPHRFRDTFADDMLNDGVSLEDLKDSLGQKSIKTTERYYIKYTKNREKARERRIYAARAATRAAASANVIPIDSRVA